MKRIEIVENVANMLLSSRLAAERSQEWVAKSLGVSKKTVQNWESGYSSPPLSTVLEWFEVLDVQPMPYFFMLLNHKSFGFITSNDADQVISSALSDYIDNVPMVEKRQLLYWALGEHGSDPASVLDMVTAHLHTPLVNRLNISQSIINNYEIAANNNNIVQPDHVLPDMDSLKESTNRARESIMMHKESYMRG